jgi:hypothetical protein
MIAVGGDIASMLPHFADATLATCIEVAKLRRNIENQRAGNGIIKKDLHRENLNCES